MEFLLLKKFLQLLLAGLFVELGLTMRKKRNKLGTAEIGKDLGKYKGTDGIILSKNHTLSQKASQEHICIIAPSGEGKTTSLFIPNLLNENLKGSIIVPDPKGELYELTHKFQSKYRKVILYKPLESGIGYNPLKNCRTDREVMQLAQNLLINGALTLEIQTGKQASGIEWLQMGQSLLTAALLYVKDKPLASISTALRLIISTSVEQLDEIFSTSKPNVVEQYNIFKSCLESPKTMSSIKITLGSNLQLFTDNLNIRTNDFTPEDLRKEPTILYISYPENKSAYLSPLMACIYSQLIDRLIDTYAKDSFPVWLLFDEFANIGQLSNFTQNIATARSRKMPFMLCLQSITQLQQLYGEKNALSILNNCKTKVVLPSLTDTETLDYLSKLCGEEEIKITQEDSKIKTKKSLFTPDEIRRIVDEKLLILAGNKSPIIDTQNIYYKQQKYLERIPFSKV
ncbi:type IV secretory system conjugative DNA transfer family protein [Clostridium sp. MSJ-11]|uniref:Type IV secretory system conjugative DNA transfer family protein n=1 Tax=Clostridium mobile TaxID=2841512 RepID=A0ABS6EN28_9CLOT|nr:type IV secretory system conjugative DNA transfer family protein [Clostridium mobile]MBU5486448.1 type IV secretory system conjugative DNA transfer family protein [Clostridium mobile]